MRKKTVVKSLFCPTRVGIRSRRSELAFKEFTGHGKIAQELGTGFFFATPYHSWERGLNEHTNGLVRQYFPKATDFHEVLGEDVRRVEELLNGRPRKVLNYRTPAERPRAED